jgi:hypothetical protein
MKGRFDPEGPLWETVNGQRYPLSNCAFCFGGFQEDKDGSPSVGYPTDSSAVARRVPLSLGPSITVVIQNHNCNARCGRI